jgi:hypothetical protein
MAKGQALMELFSTRINVSIENLIHNHFESYSGHVFYPDIGFVFEDFA